VPASIRTVATTDIETTGADGRETPSIDTDLASLDVFNCSRKYTRQ
jgi:hypothetical protein